MENVAITGIGIVSSLGSSGEELFRNLMDGRVAVCSSHWEGEDGIEHSWISAVEDFRPEDWMEDRIVAGTDRFAQFGIAAAVQAVESCGLEELDPLRTAVILGTAMAGVSSLVDAQHALDTEGRAGVMGLITGLHGMKEQALVPTGGTTDIDPEVEFRLVLGEPAEVDIKTLQVNGFGFGGQDASLVVTRN